ncbi:extracellular solute-binding protein [Microbacterium lacus]|uniref:ABC transporter substrate-binding protein n=1 Tax=Microbacterium lacus TaxID=415217 RepID=UPI00384FB956
MTRTRRITGLAIGSIAAASLLLAGCAGSSDGGASSTPDSTEPVELTISWWGNDERAALMDEVIDMFEDKHPNITVVAQPVGAPDDLFNRLATDFASGTAPDVFALGGAKPLEYGAAGALLDLDTVSDYVDLAPYPDFTLTNTTVDGKVYGLPTGGNAIGMLVNEDIFETAGVDLPTEDWTWDDLSSAAEEVSASGGEGVMGLDLRIQDIVGTYLAQITEYGMYTPEGTIGIDEADLGSWFEIEEELVANGGLPDPTVIVENWAATPDLSPFGTGRAGITFAYSNQIGSYAAGTGGASVQILPPPTDTDVSGVAVLPSQFWAIAAKSEHPAEAAMLMDFLLNDPEAAEVILSNRGLQFNPAILEVVKPLLGEADAQAAEYLERVLEIGVVAPPQPAGGGIMNELTQRTESDILFGRTTIEEGTSNWITELNASLESAG